MKVTSGIIKEPIFTLIYGTPTVGKTSFASEAPKPAIIDIEGGSHKLPFEKRFEEIESYEEVREAVKWFRNEKHDFESLALDSLDHIEPLIWKKVCDLDEGKKKPTHIEEASGGFQKGYGVAIQVWTELINDLKDLRKNRNMNVIAIAHAKVITVNDPLHAVPFDKYTIKLHENKQNSAIALWKESVDSMLFANFEDTIFKVNNNDKKGKASGDGVRKLFTTRTAAWDAKNRLGLPSELPFSRGQSWNEFMAAVERGQPDSPEQVKKDIEEILKLFEVKDPEAFTRMSGAVEKFKSDPVKMMGVRNQARMMAEKLS